MAGHVLAIYKRVELVLVAKRLIYATRDGDGGIGGVGVEQRKHDTEQFVYIAL